MKVSIFGQYIKQKREEKCWTQTDLGAKIGINATAICRIENGSQKFSRVKLPELAKVFSIDKQSVMDLFYADKFASEALENHCSKTVFSLAQENIDLLKSKKLKQSKKNHTHE